MEEKDVTKDLLEDFPIPSEDEIKEDEEFAKYLQEIYGLEEGEVE